MAFRVVGGWRGNKRRNDQLPIDNISVINRPTTYLPTTGEALPLIYIGEWDAEINDLGLASSVGMKGACYKVSVAGVTNLDGIAEWAVGDYATFNGATWDKLLGGAEGGSSLAGFMIKGDENGGLIPAEAGTDYVIPSAIADMLENNVTNTLEVGFTLAPNNLSTKTTDWTINPALGNVQYMTNGGAHQITAPAADCTVEIVVTNNASAGTLTFSGFTGSMMGDAYNTTNANVFTLVVRRVGGVTRGWWLAWQT